MLQKMFDLNKVPAVLEEELVQDFGAAGILQFQPSCETPATGMNNSFGPWQYTFGPSDLASLYNMVQSLPNDGHPVHLHGGAQVIAHRPAYRASGHSAFISWHPPHTTNFSGAGVMNTTTTVWRAGTVLPSYFAMVPVTSTPAAGAPPAAANTTASPSSQDGRVVDQAWSSAAGGQFHVDQNEVLCQTTVDIIPGMDHHDVSDGESDSCVPRNHEYSKGRSTVRLVELESCPNYCAERPVPKSADGDRIPESSQQGGVSLEAEPNLDRTLKYIRWAEKRHEDFLAEDRKKRELAFNAAFNFSTQRCTPTAPCRSCLEFCKTSLPMSHVEPVRELGALYVDEERPPVLKNMNEQEAAQRKWARHGPKSKSSEYRGVTFYKRTGRWEAHIWHGAAQVYLGASTTKEEAARAYDKAAIMLSGPDVDINFKPESYQHELEHLYKLSKEQLVIYLRRDSRGYGAQATYPGVKHVKNHYQAVYGEKLLGIFTTEEEAARAVYEEALRNSFGALASLIIDTHHIRNMPSYAAERFAAIYPEAVEAMKLKNQKGSSASTKITVSTRQNSTSPQKRNPKRKRSTRAAPLAAKPNAPPSPAGSATAAPPDPVRLQKQLPATQINEVDALPQRIRRTWGSHLAYKRAHRRSNVNLRELPQTPMSAFPERNNSRPHQISDPVNTRAPQQTWPTHLYPISPGIAAGNLTLAATAAPAWSSTCPKLSSASVLSTFSRTGPAISSSHAPHQTIASPPGSAESKDTKKPPTTDVDTAPSGTIKFKLFNVEFDVPEPGNGGNKIPPQTSNSESGVLYIFPSVTEKNGLIDPVTLPRKRCKITGEECAFDPYEFQQLPYTLSSEMDELVSINKELDEILADAAPPRLYETPQLAAVWQEPALKTGLPLDQPGAGPGGRRFPNRYRKHRKPRCTCVFRQ